MIVPARSSRWFHIHNTASAVVPAAPNEVSNLWSWHDVSTLNTLYQDAARTTPVAANSDPIGNIGDRSGNSRHLAQTGAAGTRPTYQTNIQNGLAAALYDGGDFLDTSATLDSVPMTIIGVFRTSSTVGTNRGIASVYHSTNFGARCTFTTANVLQALVSTPQVTRNSVATFGATTTIIFCGRFDTAEIASFANGSISTTTHAAPAVNNILSVGRSNVNTATSLANGHLCELAVYNRALTNNEVASLNAYFNGKWAVY